MKLAIKLSLLFLLVSLISILIISFLSYDSSKTAIENEVTEHLLATNLLKEAEIEKIKAKFIYHNRAKFFFCYEKNASKRFDLNEEAVGESAVFLKPNEIVEGLQFKGKIINVSLPIKVQLKVVEAPPGVKGNRAQGGTKTATLETGIRVEVPLFVEVGDTIEINTETGEYTRRM